jgi:hypothetical protein
MTSFYFRQRTQKNLGGGEMSGEKRGEIENPGFSVYNRAFLRD